MKRPTVFLLEKLRINHQRVFSLSMILGSSWLEGGMGTQLEDILSLSNLKQENQ